MFKRLKPLKDLLWAAGIGLCLLALLIGLASSSLTSYYGDKEVPAMNLRADMEARREKRAEEKAAREQAEEEEQEVIVYGSDGEKLSWDLPAGGEA